MLSTENLIHCDIGSRNVDRKRCIMQAYIFLGRSGYINTREGRLQRVQNYQGQRGILHNGKRGQDVPILLFF